MKGSSAGPLLVLPLAVALLCACGGEQGERPESALEMAEPKPAGGVDCAAEDSFEKTQLLQNFEAGNADGWFLYHDEFSTPLQDPPLTEQPPHASSIDGGRCGSQQALRVRAGGILEWGGFEASLPDAPFDATDFDGIAIWTRRGDGSGFEKAPATAVDFTLRERQTDGSAAAQEPSELQGVEVCDPSPPAGDPDNIGCNNGFSASIGLFEDWKLIKVPFEKLKQPSWGFQAAELDKSALYAIKFAYYGTRRNIDDPNDDQPGFVDVWIDDIFLYRE
jgi:hypothetical protein